MPWQSINDFRKICLNLMRFSEGGLDYNSLSQMPIVTIYRYAQAADELNTEIERRIKAQTPR